MNLPDEILKAAEASSALKYRLREARLAACSAEPGAVDHELAAMILVDLLESVVGVDDRLWLLASHYRMTTS